MSDRHIVLFFPSYQSDEAAPPLALIAIASPLIQAGYRVRIVDSTLEEDYVSAVLREMEGALCLGISLVTGPMVREAVEVGRAVKQRYPETPIVLGGWHPSILPEQSLQPPFVDVVVLRQGELTMLELADRFRDGASLQDVEGILWKDHGEMVRNRPRNHPRVADLPSRLAGYGLIDWDRYERATRLRWALYTTSHGCPYNCSYCSNASVYGRNLDLLPVDQVVTEICEVVRRYRIRCVGVIDDIFFAFRERSLEIAEGLVRSGLDFEWFIQDRTDCWSRLSQEEARLYHRAGLRRVFFGAESGSETVLKSIEKRARVESTLEAAQRCAQAGIRATFGFIFGLPDEGEDEMRETLDLIDRLYRVSPLADCNTNIFTPYPGSPLWPVAVQRGFEPPKEFAEWADFYPRITRLPWMDRQQHQRLQSIRQYLRFGYHQVKVASPLGLPHRMLRTVLKPTSRLRVRSKRFAFPWELYGYRALQKVSHRFQAAMRF